MKIITKTITGPLFSKDLFKLYDDWYKQIGYASAINPKYQYITSIIDFGHQIWDNPESLASQFSSSLSSQQLRDNGHRLVNTSNKWSRWKYEGDGQGEYKYRVFRARKNRILKVSTKTIDSYKQCQLTSIYELDVFRTLQWLADAKCIQTYWNISKGEILGLLSKIADYSQKDKIFNMHFGEEYTGNKKRGFNKAVAELITDISAQELDTLLIDVTVQGETERQDNPGNFDVPLFSLRPRRNGSRDDVLIIEEE